MHNLVSKIPKNYTPIAEFVDVCGQFQGCIFCGIRGDFRPGKNPPLAA